MFSLHYILLILYAESLDKEVCKKFSAKRLILSQGTFVAYRQTTDRQTDG